MLTNRRSLIFAGLEASVDTDLLAGHLAIANFKSEVI